MWFSLRFIAAVLYSKS